MATHQASSPGPSHAKLAVIRRLLEEQKSLLGQLDALSLRQEDLIDDPDSKRLVSLMRDRQAVIDRFAEVSRRVGEVRPEIDAVVGTLMPASSDVVEIKHLLQAVGDLAAAIQDRDAKHQSRMEKRRDQLVSELAGIGNKSRAVSAYGSRKAIAPRYQDQDA